MFDDDVDNNIRDLAIQEAVGERKRNRDHLLFVFERYFEREHTTNVAYLHRTHCDASFVSYDPGPMRDLKREPMSPLRPPCSVGFLTL